MKPTPSVGRILTAPGNRLQTLLQRAGELQALTTHLRRNLDATLASHVAVTNIRDDTAIIATDSPAWLTVLRYQAGTILTALRHEPGLERLEQLQFKILPEMAAAPPPPPVFKRVISDSSARLIRDAAESLPDENIRNALLRLSGRTHSGRG